MLLPLNRSHFVSGKHEITYKALWQEAVELQGRELGMQRWRAHGRVGCNLLRGTLAHHKQIVLLNSSCSTGVQHDGLQWQSGRDKARHTISRFMDTMHSLHN